MNKVVILMQGPIFLGGNTDIFESNLKKMLYEYNINADILVSTWDCAHEIKKYLENNYQKVKFIYNADPGHIIHNAFGINIKCNINRLIISTVNGLKNIDKDKVIIKIRTDSYLKNLVALDYLQQYKNNSRDEQFSIFSNYILCCSQFVRNPNSHLPFLYHPSDIMVAGKHADLLKYFDVPLADISIFKETKGLVKSTHFRYTPEQYLFINAIKKHQNKKSPQIDFSGNFMNPSSEIEKSNRFLINNFIFIPSKKLEFYWTKYNLIYRNKGWSSLYDMNDWCYLHNLYYDRNLKVNIFVIKYKNTMIFLGKIYFLFRNFLLRSHFIRKTAYKLFTNR